LDQIWVQKLTKIGPNFGPKSIPKMNRIGPKIGSKIGQNLDLKMVQK